MIQPISLRLKKSSRLEVEARQRSRRDNFHLWAQANRFPKPLRYSLRQSGGGSELRPRFQRQFQLRKSALLKRFYAELLDLWKLSHDVLNRARKHIDSPDHSHTTHP